MNISELFSNLIGQPEDITLEYKATLIPSRAIAQILAAFANTQGGVLIFGVREKPGKPIEPEGLSSDFNVQGMIVKAIGLLQPAPKTEYTYFFHKEKQLFGIRIEKSKEPVIVEGQVFIRKGDKVVNTYQKEVEERHTKFPRFSDLSKTLNTEKVSGTGAKKRFLDHYLNILRLYEPTLSALFPASISELTSIAEGKTLNRILFTSCIDNFETYLSELLYEIYLVKPDTLKGGDSMVRVSEVLDCTDIEEFIQRFAAKRVSKLNKGSIKGFLKDNAEISNLKAISDEDVTEVEKILQIRHLYTHRNGIVDESFLSHFRVQYTLNTEHQMSISEVVDKLEFLIGIVKEIDKEAISKYGLSIENQ